MIQTDREYYGEYADLLEEKRQWLVDSLQDILDNISMDSEKRPAEHLLGRIKSAQSVREKMEKRNTAADADNALKTLSDIIGIRIVVHFVGDVYEILHRITASDLWKTVAVKDYITSPKANGYRSLHVILAIPFNGKDFDSLNIEIQLRTIAMDCWASLEHQLKYKKSIGNVDLIVNELSRCAASMASVDLTLQTIREMIEQG